MFPNVPQTGQPLSGLLVLDCTVFQQGTQASAMLADFGADVIKVEGPDSPDPGRAMATGAAPGAPFNGYWETHNHNKRGVVIDFKHPEGREAMLRLARDADVLVQNLRQGVMEKLGLGYADVRARNPGIIYATASGYGSKGPHSKWPAMDILGQARGGTMMSMGPPDEAPFFAFGGMADHIGAMSLAYGIMAALWHRARTGEGQMVEASLLGGQMFVQGHNITNATYLGKAPPRRQREDCDALWNVYACRDGRYLAVSMLQSERWWPLFMDAVDCPAIRNDPRFQGHDERRDNRGALVAALDGLFAQKDQWEWITYLCERGLPVAPVQDYSQLPADPQVTANGYLVEFDHPHAGRVMMAGPAAQLSATPAEIRRAAPEFGEHTEEVLLERGFAWDEIARLRTVGAVGPR